MFSEIEKTAYPPSKKPMMIWDGDCGFCKYWIIRYKSKTEDRVSYKTYQEAAGYFKDIPLKEFQKASRFIDLNGTVYSGPNSIYKTFTYYIQTPSPQWHNLYNASQLFRFISNSGYNFIAKNRSFMFKLTRSFLGNNPTNLKWYRPFLFLFAVFTFIVLLNYL
ncbi:MAG: thiol-disulfide oxidoreductase [Aequorivita sp.]|nr:thiol-disulfide oxidoreductase [Aequorivita sp.]